MSRYGKSTNWGMICCGLVLSLPLAGYLLAIYINGIYFAQDCGGHLKRAADANSVELAKSELSIAVNHAKNHNLTSGYTSVVYQTPDEDLGFWFNNLSASLDELNKVNDKTSSLEKTNVLMKLRETLLDNGKSGDCLTVPDGISVYPHNVEYAVWGVISLAIAAFGAILAFCGLGD